MSEGLNYDYSAYRTKSKDSVRSIAEQGEGGRRKLDFTLELLDGFLRAGMIVLDEQCKVRASTSRAQSLFEGRTGMEIRNGFLRIERASVHRRLGEILAGICQGAGEQSPSVIGVPDNDGRVRFALKVMPLPRFGGPPVALLAVVDLLNQDSVPRRTVALLFGLSDREAELADFFSRGLRIDEIAREMGVTPNTARVHLRSVFNKTGCTSQVELARLIALIP